MRVSSGARDITSSQLSLPTFAVCRVCACYAYVSLVQAFAGAVHAILVARGNFVAGVRSNLLAGGDNCCRASFVGAVLAAIGDETAGGIPVGWCARTERSHEVARLAVGVAAHNKHAQ